MATFTSRFQKVSPLRILTCYIIMYLFSYREQIFRDEIAEILIEITKSNMQIHMSPQTYLFIKIILFAFLKKIAIFF